MASRFHHASWTLIHLLGAIAGLSLSLTPALAVETQKTQEDLAQSSELPKRTENPTPAANESVSESRIKILSPEHDSVVNDGSGAITVQSPKDEGVELRVNRQLIDASQIGQTQFDPATGLIKQTWYDVTFKPGANTITVHREGKSQPLATSIIHRGAKYTKAEDKATPVDGQTIAIISPINHAVLDQPATSITVQSPVDDVLELRVDGRLIDNAQIGRTAIDSEIQAKQETWYGVTLASGDNVITVTRQGESEILATISAQVRGTPTAIKVGTVEKTIPADGVSTATVTGQLLDENKNRSAWNSTVTLHTTGGTFVGVDEMPNVEGFQVKANNGAFSAQLQSDATTGSVRLHAKSNDLEGYHQLEFVPPLRPSPLLTGVADFRFGRRGTNFHGSLRDFLPQDRDNSFQFDASASAFGTASIGEWLITGAVNSERPLNENCNGESTLFRAVGDCDETLYPVYGDNSKSEVIAPSKDQFFLKIERSSRVSAGGIDYFMWGDYNTQELNRESQTFTGIGRDLHGFKGNYNLGDLQITGFYGNNTDGFQRDTIAPDGTSGYYFLSRRFLIPGSEEIYLELEELNRPGTVLDRKRLSRGADYDIDYDRGSILFREPVRRTDIGERGEVLVRRIVSTYQYESEGGKTDIYGGRLQYNLSRASGQESWVGATYFRENKGAQNFELYGADAKVAFGKNGQLIAEYARSHNSLDHTEKVSGDAYRAEISGTLFDKVKGKGYFRTTDEGFSNDATTSFVPGQTRYGAAIDAEVSKHTTLRVSYDHEDNFGVAPKALDRLEDLIQPGTVPEPGSPRDNSLTTIRAGVLQKIGKASLGVDWVHRDRNDKITDTRVVSDQLSSSFKMPITNTLNIHAYNDLTLSSQSDPLYPSRTTVGLDWRFHPDVTLFVDNTLLSGGQYDGDVITSLGLKGAHTFSTDTTLRGELTMLSDKFDPRGLGGRFGIDQGVTLTPGLDLDFSYEYVFNEQFETAAGEQFIQPFAVGSGASALPLTSGHSFSAGINYTRNPNLQLGANIEHRTNKEGSNTVITANALGNISRDLTGLLSYRQASAANPGLSDLGVDRELKLGLAFRNPQDDTFNGLLRYEFRQNPSIIPETLLSGQGTGSESHLLALEGIYAPTWRWELYGKAGFRHSKTHLAKNLVSASTSPLAQLRATHRLNYQWDLTAEARWIGQPSAGYDEFGVNAEVGYYLNPNIRLSAGYAFGAINDRDLGNSRSSDGPYLGLTLKLDNNLFKDFGFRKSAALRKQQSESKASKSSPTELTLTRPVSSPDAKQTTRKTTSPATSPEATPTVEVVNAELYQLTVVHPSPEGA